MSSVRPLKAIITGLFPGISSVPQKLKGFIPFFISYITYQKRAKNLGYSKLRIKEIFPQFDDRYQQSGNISQHYFFQDIWAAKLIYNAKPEVHYDVGSRIDGFVAHVSIFCKIKVIDIRPQSISIKNVKFIKGDITDLPFENESIASLSCLHAAEHVGLGRYGDAIDPEGTQKAAKELQRVLKKGGELYFSVPIGKEKVCFNAHRVFSPQTILGYFDQLSLESYSTITEDNEFFDNADIENPVDKEYDCGLFHFKKV